MPSSIAAAIVSAHSATCGVHATVFTAGVSRTLRGNRRRYRDIEISRFDPLGHGNATACARRGSDSARCRADAGESLVRSLFRDAVRRAWFWRPRCGTTFRSLAGFRAIRLCGQNRPTVSAKRPLPAISDLDHSWQKHSCRVERRHLRCVGEGQGRSEHGISRSRGDSVSFLARRLVHRLRQLFFAP